MKVPNINCYYYNSFGLCNKRPRTFFGLFKAKCIEAGINQQNSKCALAKRFPKPILPHLRQNLKNESERAFGKTIIGTWSCSKCGYSITPKTLRESQNSFVWSTEANLSSMGLKTPHCKKCSIPMMYDEET